jgi:ATP-dependent DNA helicase RecG
VGLLTHAYCRLDEEDISRADFQDRLTSGSGCCLVGTHALLEEKLPLPHFDLIVIDEQHRFGVAQRHALLERQKDQAPHLLSMTATPIPRSLALTICGDLDISCLTQMPKGRKPVATAFVPVSQQEGMWKHVRGQIEAGERVFIVCPLIDPSDRLGVQSVEETSAHLRKEAFKGLAVGMLHGKMKSDEKEKIMEEFRSGKICILVSTTVVEVGVDVPEATVMIILGAERFGLAQLHQLRGRVGRGEKQSYCYLLSEALSDRSRARLEAMVKMHNGFDLAQKDLELRGPGDMFGSQQSGFPDFQFATPADEDLMKKARHWAERLTKEDPNLEACPLVRQKMREAFELVHLE